MGCFDAFSGDFLRVLFAALGQYSAYSCELHDSRLLLEDARSDLEGCLQEFPVLLEVFQGTPVQALEKPVAAQRVCCRVVCVFSHNI